ncbi:MAG: nucleotidyltransferase domain-containing protein [Hydrogenothermaceae bacterium]|nr:nucleotidyltransferase domain-containing protein [Hydrogenothermaceae bacterium]
MMRKKVEEYIQDIVEELKKYNPERIILFGSRAKGTATKSSDIDIAVDLDLDYREERKLKEKLDEISGLYSVDIVFLPKVKEEFKQQILKEGVTLYERE